MANSYPYQAGEESRKRRMASMLAPNAYTAKTKSEQASIDRRAKMIELLQGQADAPIERFSYGGIEAYTPPTAYLAKILSGAMAGYQSGKAGREQEALDKYKEQAQNEDMAVIREAASMPRTSLNLRPGTQATDLTQMNENLLPGMDPFTGSIPARRYTTITPEGSQAMFDLTQADRRAVEDLETRKEESRAEMLARQFEKQAVSDARIEAARLKNEQDVAAELLRNENNILNQKNLAQQQRDRERAEYGLPPEVSAGETTTPSAGTPPKTLAEAKMQQALDQKQRENTQTQLLDAQKALPKLEKNAKDLFSVIDQIATFNEKDEAKKHPGFDSVVGTLTGKVSKYYPGSKAADFQAIMDQLGGKAFLEAYASLRGGGPITDIEGEKATKAIAALSTSQSPDAFLKNLKVFKSSVQESLDDARKKAGVNNDGWKPL